MNQDAYITAGPFVDLRKHETLGALTEFRWRWASVKARERFDVYGAFGSVIIVHRPGEAWRAFRRWYLEPKAAKGDNEPE